MKKQDSCQVANIPLEVSHTMKQPPSAHPHLLPPHLLSFPLTSYLLLIAFHPLSLPSLLPPPSPSLSNSPPPSPYLLSLTYLLPPLTFSLWLTSLHLLSDSPPLIFSVWLTFPHLLSLTHLLPPLTSSLPPHHLPHTLPPVLKPVVADQHIPPVQLSAVSSPHTAA